MTKSPLPRLHGRLLRASLAASALALLAACDADGTFDADLRNFGQIGFDTSDAAKTATEARPSPDARGVISYPNYQVAVANRGDTVASVAARVGLDAGELARYNAVAPDAALNRGEVLALPRRVAEPAGTAVASGAPAGAGALSAEKIDITAIASTAIDRAEAGKPAAAVPAPSPAPAPAASAAVPEPVRHKVTRGETAYSIARYYDVPVKSLAEWNGLPADLSVREGQYLLIPVASAKAPARPDPVAVTTEPGTGSPTPTPPSAAKPLPAEKPVKASAPVDKSAAPDLGATRTASAAKSKLQMPVSGAIIRPYVKKKNDGVDIAAAPGTPVAAAEAGTVAAITKDTEQVPILVLRHEGGLLTVYANIDAITVKKGDTVKRGQTIAKVRASEPGFVHFEVRQGFDSVDPMPYLQ
ncbi:MAG: M23 family metallopeptidase [Sphingomonadales bacterium]|nr:M23 family metallopeptidase [Sphingomonadales bacterium]